MRPSTSAKAVLSIWHFPFPLEANGALACASTTLHDTAFSSIPGAPAYVSKASKYTANNADLGIDVDLEGHNAVHGDFVFEG